MSEFESHRADKFRNYDLHSAFKPKSMKRILVLIAIVSLASCATNRKPQTGTTTVVEKKDKKGRVVKRVTTETFKY
jgi:uncharacterized protein (DUF2141 family)